jgi:hypothetical protein
MCTYSLIEREVNLLHARDMLLTKNPGSESGIRDQENTAC